MTHNPPTTDHRQLTKDDRQRATDKGQLTKDKSHRSQSAPQSGADAAGSGGSASQPKCGPAAEPAASSARVNADPGPRAMAALVAHVSTAPDPGTLPGLEGQSAAIYFARFGRMYCGVRLLRRQSRKDDAIGIPVLGKRLVECDQYLATRGAGCRQRCELDVEIRKKHRRPPGFPRFARQSGGDFLVDRTAPGAV